MDNKFIDLALLEYYNSKLKTYLNTELDKKANATRVTALESRVPAPSTSSATQYLRANGTWGEIASANGSTAGLVKTGGDVTISNGVITVNDNSHNHTASNITDLQDVLDGYVPVSTTINGIELSGGNIRLGVDDIAGAVSTAELGSTIATLEDGKIPIEYLPSYVDDVIEGASKTNLPVPGESSKIYVTLDDNKTYRWSGTEYVEISASLALGETTGTAYDGAKGKANADAISSLQTTVGGHTTDIGNLQSGLNTASGKISTLEQTIDGIVSVGGEANVINEIQVNGVKVEPVDKVVNITMDTYFNFATEAEIDALFGIS